MGQEGRDSRVQEKHVEKKVNQDSTLRGSKFAALDQAGNDVV